MTLLDAYALIAFLVGGPAQAHVRRILRDGDAAVATVNLAESLDVSARLHGLPIARAMEILEPLFEGPVAAIPLDIQAARRAAALRAAHYHRSLRPISMADAVLIASAQGSDRIATADKDILAIAEAEKLEVIALPEQG